MTRKNTLISRIVSGGVFFLAFGSPLGSAEKGAPPWFAPLEAALADLHLHSSDLMLPAGLPLAHTIPIVESFFAHPVAASTQTAAWLGAVEQAGSPPALFQVAHAILDPAQANLVRTPRVKKTDRRWDEIVNTLLAAVDESQRAIEKAGAKLTPPEKADVLSLFEIWREGNAGGPQEISAARIKAKYDLAAKVDQREILKAGRVAIDALSQAAQDLALLATFPSKSRITYRMPQGKVLASGPGDDVYTADDLRDAVLVIDMGGSNRYEAPPAAAGPGQVRLVLDFGSEITVSTRPAWGGPASGLFGVGIMMGPAPGKKVFATGSWSLGCGLFGVGGLFLQGEAHLSGDIYTQGVGAFGVGILQIHSGHGSVVTAVRNGQGAGFPRGVGLLATEGDDQAVKGGLVEPDPREPLGSVSLCQGVGFGHRAYSGGGVGLASLRGSRVTVEGSYFAQGCGYWHGVGGFRLAGSSSTVQARRYDQGAGVHSAFGHFEVAGNHNRILNWGVGPAYGWDRGYGSADIRGNDNEVQVDWGAATAAIGSLSFSRLTGNGNKLKMPQMGSGSFFRNEFAYAAHLIEGDNRLLFASSSSASAITVMATPWGLFRGHGLRLDPSLPFTPPVWSALPPGNLGSRSSPKGVDLNSLLSASAKMSNRDRVSRLLDVAAAFSLDKENPRMALTRLLELNEADIPVLIDVLIPEAVEQLIQARIVLAAHGPTAAGALAGALNGSTENRRAVLLGLFGLCPPSQSLGALLEELRAATSPIQQAVIASVLGQLLNRDPGQEPGFRAVMTALSQVGPEAGFNPMLARLRLPEAFSALSAALEMDAAKRRRILQKAPADVTETVGEAVAKEIMGLVLSDPNYQSGINGELAVMNRYEPDVRAALNGLLISSHTMVMHGALVSLGQIGNAGDISVLERFLTHPQARLRSAAMVALARMGEAGFPSFRTLINAEGARERRLAISAIPHATTQKFQEIWRRGLVDEHPLNRVLTLSTLSALPPALLEREKEFKGLVEKRLAVESDQSVRVAMKTALGLK